MPELPEVQTIVSDLGSKIIDRRITGVWADRKCQASLLVGGREKKARAERVLEKLEGARFLKVDRHGKNILFYLKNKREELCLLVHLKMTGHFLFGQFSLKGRPAKLVPIETDGALVEKKNGYIRFALKLNDGRFLAFSDLRRFAKIIVGRPEDLIKSDHLAIGPDALSPALTLKEFKKRIKKHRSIKTILLDQAVVAGLGNIYTDEILWLARVHPLVKGDELKEGQIEAIFKSMRLVLRQSLRLRGTTFSDYRDLSGKTGGYFKKRRVYKRSGEACPRCGAPIGRLKIGNRSAHFCPKCQKPD